MLHLYDTTEVVVYYRQTVKELMALGKYSSACRDINDTNFPPEAWEEPLLVDVVRFKIWRAPKAMEFEEVAIGLYQERCRGASLRQGLSFGVEKSQMHKKISLVMPGSFWRNPKTAYKTRSIPELYSISSSRHVYLRQLDVVFPPETFFLSTSLKHEPKTPDMEVGMLVRCKRETGIGRIAAITKGEKPFWVAVFDPATSAKVAYREFSEQELIVLESPLPEDVQQNVITLLSTSLHKTDHLEKKISQVNHFCFSWGMK